MDETELTGEASRLTEEALTAANMADPRPLYRELMRALKVDDDERFYEASERFHSAVVPAIARDGADPVSEWIGYGRWLASRTRAGKFVQVDTTGRATDPAASHSPSDVLLHIPREAKHSVLLVASPARPSAAQRATLELLIGPVAAPS